MGVSGDGDDGGEVDAAFEDERRDGVDGSGAEQPGEAAADEEGENAGDGEPPGVDERQAAPRLHGGATRIQRA